MSRAKPKKTFEDDDMRVVAPMNVDGMPWYAPKPKTVDGESKSEMTREEEKIYRHAALKAGLLVALVYGVCFLLFIVICLLVWR